MKIYILYTNLTNVFLEKGEKLRFAILELDEANSVTDIKGP